MNVNMSHPDTDKLVNENSLSLSVAPDQTSTKSSWYPHVIQPCVAEFIGIVLFVFIGVVAATVKGTLLIDVALAHGFTITLLVVALGHISGAHFNPSVTLGCVIAGATPPLLGIGYVFCQLIGGMVGAGLARGIANTTEFEAGLGGAQTIDENVIKPFPALCCEMLLTTVLVLTVLMSAVDSSGNRTLAPMAIGMAVLVDILAGGKLTGASMNPARTFGPAIAISYNNTHIWDYHYIYWVGPLLGGALAGLIYRICLASNDKRLIFK